MYMGWLKNYFCGKGVDKVVELAQDNIKMYDAMILIAGWLKSGEVSNVPSIPRTFIDADNEQVVFDLFDAARSVLNRNVELRKSIPEKWIERREHPIGRYVPIVREGEGKNVIDPDEATYMEVKSALDKNEERIRKIHKLLKDASENGPLFLNGKEVEKNEHGLYIAPTDYLPRNWKKFSKWVPEATIGKSPSGDTVYSSLMCNVILDSGEQVDAKYYATENVWRTWNKTEGLVDCVPIMWRYRKDC